MLFYRVARSDPPTEQDFYSQARRRGKEPPAEANEDEWQAYRRISVWDSFAGAEAMARRYRKMGEYVVTLDIPDQGPIASFPLTPAGHYDLDGDAAQILQCWVPPAVKVK